jgi:hypothetical protein
MVAPQDGIYLAKFVFLPLVLVAGTGAPAAGVGVSLAVPLA